MTAKIVAILALIAAIFTGGWSLGSGHTQNQWDKERLKLVEDSRIAAEANQKQIKELERTKDENLKTIDNLRDDVAGLRVRVPKTPCARPDTTSRGGDGTAASGEPADKTQESFDDFRRGLESDAASADKIIESCRVVVDWAKGLVKE